MTRLAVALTLLIGASPLYAQTGPIHLDQYRPAPSVDDGFAISRPDDRGHVLFGARLDLDYALNPLVVERSSGDATTEEGSLVEHQLALHLGLSLGLFDRLVIYAGLPVSLVQQGLPFGGLPAGDGAGMGDVLLGARGRLFGEPSDPFALALQLTATFPTASAVNVAQSYSGERGLTLHPSVLFELRPASIFRITGNLGVRARVDAPAFVANLGVTHELTWGVGLTLDAVEELLSVYAELWGSAGFDSFGQDSAREATPVEALLGARVQVVQGLEIGAAIGTGISRGYGAPDLRGVFTIGYAMRPVRGEPAPAEEPEEPDVAPVTTDPSLDRDRDNVLDQDDECPDEPEDRDRFEDENGCPDPDNDADGVLDEPDACPTEPEDRDEFEDENGCPEPDNDRDGVLDPRDACKNDPEDVDQFEDEDGCPEDDNDLDTVLDREDECPNEPGDPRANGCPRSVRVDRATGTIQILQRVEFATNRDVILQQSMPILEEVRGVLAVNRDILVVRVEGHTDDRGNDRHNMDLSARRARSVANWMVQHGIDPTRLRAFGCGEVLPLSDNRTDEGQQANRRVEFHILEPVPRQGARELPGCSELRVGRARIRGRRRR